MYGIAVVEDEDEVASILTSTSDPFADPIAPGPAEDQIASKSYLIHRTTSPATLWFSAECL